MKVLRDPQIISGFIYEEPVDELPALTHCGEALCVRGHRLPTHSHDAFEFLYLSRGAASWRIADRTVRQQMGEMLITLPGQAHSSLVNPENYHLWMGLKLDELGREGRALATALRKAWSPVLKGCHEAEPLLRGLIRQVVGGWPKRDRVVLSYIRAFIALVEQHLAALRGGAVPGWDSAPLPYSHAIRKALSFMEQNLDRRVPLRDIAAVATARSVPHFCSQFHREVGQSPSAFHLKLRLEAASGMLRQPSCTITMAAHEYGFSSSQHFSSSFRRLFKTTPRQWMLAGKPVGE